MTVIMPSCAFSFITDWYLGYNVRIPNLKVSWSLLVYLYIGRLKEIVVIFTGDFPSVVRFSAIRFRPRQVNNERCFLSCSLEWLNQFYSGGGVSFPPHRSSYFYDDPVVEEVTTVLREWGAIWKQSYLVSLLQRLSLRPLEGSWRRSRSTLPRVDGCCVFSVVRFVSLSFDCVYPHFCICLDSKI